MTHIGRVKQCSDGGVEQRQAGAVDNAGAVGCMLEAQVAQHAHTLQCDIQLCLQ